MKSPGHILVIRLSAMGDVAMTIPVLKKLTQHYLDTEFTILTRKFFAPLFEDLPRVKVFEAEVDTKYKGIGGLKKLAGELRELEIDAVADLHDVLRSNVLDVFFKVYGIPVRQIDKGRAEKKALTRKRNKKFRPLKATHQRYAEVFAELNLPVDLSSVDFLEKKKLSPQVRELTGIEPRKWLGVAPFAQHESKTYPEDLMKQVLKDLQENEQLKIFLFGGGSKEEKMLNEWEKEFPNVINAAGKFSFREELGLISNLDAMLSMDSGNGHLAANYGVPVLSLWGLTHPHAGFAPFAQPQDHSLVPDLERYPEIPTSIYGTKTPAKYEDAMRTIPAGKVVEKLKEILNLQFFFALFFSLSLFA